MLAGDGGAPAAAITELRRDVPPRIAHALIVGLAPNHDDRHITASNFVRVIEETIDLRAAREACIAVLASVRREGTRGPASVARLAAQQADTDETALFSDKTAPSAPATQQATASLAPAVPAPWLVPSHAPVAHSQKPAAMGRNPLPWLAAAGLGVLVLGSAVVLVARHGREARASAAASEHTSAAVAPTEKPVAPAQSIAVPPANAAASTNMSAPIGTTAPDVEPNATASATPPQMAGAADGAAVSRTGTIVTGSAAEHHRVYVAGRVVGEGEGTFEVPCGRHVVRVGSAGHDQSVVVPCGGSVDVR